MSAEPSTTPRSGNPNLGLVSLCGAAALALAWAASHSGAATGSRLGHGLSRLDGGAAVLLVAGAAAAQFAVTSRALGGEDAPGLTDRWRHTLRGLLLPWWAVVTFGLFMFPTAAGLLVPSDDAAPTWIVVGREWLLAGSLAPPDPALPATVAGRLGLGWLVTVAALAALALPLWERALRRAAGDPVAVALRAATGLVVAGLAIRVAVAAADVAGWWVVARWSPLAQLDLIGAGMAVGTWAAARRDGRTVAPSMSARSLLLGASGLTVVTWLVVPAALGWSATASALQPDGAVRELVMRVLLVAVAGLWSAWALAAPHLTDRLSLPAPATAWRAAWVMVMVTPLASQMWALRAGGPPGTQKIGTMILLTVLGAGAAAWAIAAITGRIFGPALDRTLTPFWARLWTVTGMAFAWRLLTLVSINRVNPTGGDPFYYHHQANMLVDRVGYSEPFRWVRWGQEVPSAIHPPLMSTWLALGSGIGARTFLAHKMLAALLGVGVVLVAGLIGRRLAGDRAGVIVAVLVAAYPNLWVIDGALWPEGVYSTMVALAVLAAYRWWDRPDIASAALLGLAIALAALTRGEALFLYPIMVAPLALARRGITWPDRIKSVAVVGLVGLVLFAPWTVRNYRAFDTFIPLSTNSDEVLYYANCDESYYGPLLGYWSFNCQERERDATGEPEGNEAEKAKYWRAKGVAYARENKGRIPTVVAARLLREVDLFRPGQNILLLRIEGRPEGASRAGQYAWWAMAPVGIAGLVLLRRRDVLVWPLVSLAAMVLVTTVYAYGAIRFRTPMELALLVGAGVAVDAAWRRWGDRGSPDGSAGSGAAGSGAAGSGAAGADADTADADTATVRRDASAAASGDESPVAEETAP